MADRLVYKMIAARKEQGLSQRALAKLIGCSNSTISRLERLEGHGDDLTRAKVSNWLSGLSNPDRVIIDDLEPAAAAGPSEILQRHIERLERLVWYAVLLGFAAGLVVGFCLGEFL